MAQPIYDFESARRHSSSTGVEGDGHIFEDSDEFMNSTEFHPVEKVKIKKYSREDGIAVRHFDVTMEGGMRHEGVFVLPDRGAQRVLPRSDILRLGGTAWFTSVNDGYNVGVQKEEASDFGIPSVAIGTQQNPFRFGNISQYAHNIIEVGKYFADKYDLNASAFTKTGDSRDAEITAAVASMSHLHEVTTLYADSKALCGAEEIPLTPKGAWEFASELLKIEATNGARELAKHSLAKAWSMRKSVDVHPYKLVQHLKDAKTLRTDEASKIIKNYADKDMFLFIAQDRLDPLAKTHLWEAGLTPEIFSRLLLDIYEGEDGSHLGACAGPRALESRMGRVANIYALIHQFGDQLQPLGKDGRIALHEAAISTVGTDFHRVATKNSTETSLTVL